MRQALCFNTIRHARHGSLRTISSCSSSLLSFGCPPPSSASICLVPAVAACSRNFASQHVVAFHSYRRSFQQQQPQQQVKQQDSGAQITSVDSASDSKASASKAAAAAPSSFSVSSYFSGLMASFNKLDPPPNPPPSYITDGPEPQSGHLPPSEAELNAEDGDSRPNYYWKNQNKRTVVRAQKKIEKEQAAAAAKAAEDDDVDEEDESKEKDKTEPAGMLPRALPRVYLRSTGYLSSPELSLGWQRMVHIIAVGACTVSIIYSILFIDWSLLVDGPPPEPALNSSPANPNQPMQQQQQTVKKRRHIFTDLQDFVQRNTRSITGGAGGPQPQSNAK